MICQWREEQVIVSFSCRHLALNAACHTSGWHVKSAAVLTILSAEALPHPSRSFAEAAWRQNPAIAASWWRENLGFTHSKVVLDARGQAALPQLPEGVNVLLGSAPWPTSLPEGVVGLLVTPNVNAPADIVLLPLTEAMQTHELLAALTELEQRVMQGTLQAYGVAAPCVAEPDTRWPLHAVLAVAQQAAMAAWGRPKRPAIRVLLAPLDVLDLSLLFNANTLHKEARVSPLELAARLGWWVLVVPQAQPQATACASTMQAALAALTQVAEAEARLHQTLHGQWPHLAGQPMFMALQALQAGHAPWPTPLIAQRFVRHIWPVLEEALQGLPSAEPLRQAWDALLPNLGTLAVAAAALPAQQALQRLALPAPWGALPPMAQQVALLASIPGVGGVLVPPTLDTTPLLALPDIADVGAVLGADDHGAALRC